MKYCGAIQTLAKVQVPDHLKRDKGDFRTQRSLINYESEWLVSNT